MTMMIPLQDGSARNNNSNYDIESSLQWCWDDECAAAFAAAEKRKIQEKEDTTFSRLYKAAAFLLKADGPA